MFPRNRYQFHGNVCRPICVLVSLKFQDQKFQDQRTMYVWSWTKAGSGLCLYTPVSPSVTEMQGIIYMPVGGSGVGGILFESEFRSCVKVEVAVLGSPSLTVLMVSVEVKQHWTWTILKMFLWCSSSTLYLLACQVRVTVGNSGRCCCVCVTSFEY